MVTTNALLVCVCCFLFTCANALRTPSQPFVKTPIGTIYGRWTAYSQEYLGIPYANNTRWMPPQSLANIPFENGSFNATEFGDCCPQLDIGLYIPSQSEDCLSLNVFTPKNTSPTTKLPVMVWIHGGGGTTGCAAQSLPALYNGSNLIESAPNNVIVVSINYRLGILGALYLNELVDENPAWPTAGNYFILDMQSALSWVQTNIGWFGGDPTQVTLFGESAGGNSGIDLAASPGSKGLFQRVISESGTPVNYAGYSNVSTIMETSNKFTSTVGCGNLSDSELLTCLRNVSVEYLMTNFSASGFIGITVIDGVVYPYYPTVAIEKGAYLPVDILMGNNLPDAWPACAALPDMSRDIAVSYLSETLPLWGCPKDLVPQALDTYGLTNCSANSTAASCCEIVTEMFLDFMMVCNAQRIFNGMINNQYSNKFFWYRMDCNASCPESSLHGACQHTSEIQFVFNTLSNYQSHSDNSTCQWNAETQQFSAQIINKWVQFAYGTLATDPEWLPYDPTSPQFFYISPSNDFRMEQFMDGGYCESIWNPLDAAMIQQMFH